MLFRPTIGTWCKGTANLWSREKVTIAMAFELLANCLPITPCIFRMPRCTLFGKHVTISGASNWS